MTKTVFHFESFDEAANKALSFAVMTPADLKLARYRLGLSAEGLAAMGEILGARVAQSGRTVRRWERGDRTIPGPVKLLVRLALESAAVRRALGLQEWVGDVEEIARIDALEEAAEADSWVETIETEPAA